MNRRQVRPRGAEMSLLDTWGPAILMSNPQPEHAPRVADPFARVGAGRLIGQRTGDPAAVKNLAGLSGADAAEVARCLTQIE